MQMAARDDSAAADAADLRHNANCFVIPDPRTLSDFESLSDNSEKVSPSQYRPGSQKCEGSDGSDDGLPSDESSDEEVEISEEEIVVDEEVEVVPRVKLNKKAALKVDCHAMMRNLNAMSEQLQAVMRLQMQHKNGKRLREDDGEVGDPGPSTLAHRARAAEFTPPRKKHRELVPPSSDSDDDDVESLVSQASSTRKKVQPDFLMVESKDTPRFSQSEIRGWLRSFAMEQMNKAGPYIDKKPKETDLGGMKLAHVSLRFPFLRFAFSFASRPHQLPVCRHTTPELKEDFTASNFTVHSARNAIACSQFRSRRTPTGFCFSSRASTPLIAIRVARVC